MVSLFFIEISFVLYWAIPRNPAQTGMADTLSTESEGICALECLKPQKGARPDELFPKVLVAISPYTAPALVHMFNLSLQTAQVPNFMTCVYFISYL